MAFGVIWGNAFKVFSGFFGIRLQCNREHVCYDTLPWLISFSLGSSLTSKGGGAVRWKAVRSLLA
jgi:hypothetical protein